MTQQTEINLKMAPAGAELIVRALRSATPLPDANIDSFVAEIWGQYQAQIKAAMEAAKEAAQAAQGIEDVVASTDSVGGAE